MEIHKKLVIITEVLALIGTFEVYLKYYFLHHSKNIHTLYLSSQKKSVVCKWTSMITFRFTFIDIFCFVSLEVFAYECFNPISNSVNISIGIILRNSTLRFSIFLLNIQNTVTGSNKVKLK